VRIHVLAGCRDLLKPEILAPEVVADLIGPNVRVANAYWISPRCGDRYHAFLQDEPGDRRIAVMAQALKDGFETRFEPMLILADLLDEGKPDNERGSPGGPPDGRSQREVLSEILDTGHVRRLQLHGLALPSKADPDGSWAVPAGIDQSSVRERIERLRAVVADHLETDAVTTRVLEVNPDHSVFGSFYNNALCNQFARRLEPRMLEHGWAPDFEALAGAISSILSDWNGKGMYVGLPLREDHLESMTDLLFKRLLRR